ncbi:C40 family peptidase [Saccharomonospora saliphila]|uniref:C40 family peptidase n=1 Tax=Saccharomonospora saliphila TaxID=369829 RepID=UPI00036C4685|nr:C40 family peptidase [Saccharomonospora saliphila]
MFTTAFKRSLAVLTVTAGTLVAAGGTGTAMMSQEGAGQARGGGAPARPAAASQPPEAGKAPETKHKPAAPGGSRIVELAASQEGKPYVYGAEGPARFDCSGLVQYVHRQAGIDLPRTSRQQRAALPHIPRSEMRPGDLLFFHNGGHVYHVGIFAGRGSMWAAPEPGDVVRKQNVWTDSYTVGRAW